MTSAKTTTKTMAEVTIAKAVRAKAPPLKQAKPPIATESVAVQEVTKPKHKLVRDSFTIPKSEYAVLEALKLRAVTLSRPAKKSEVLRAGVAALTVMSDKAFLAALNNVPSLKTGRPKGN